LEVFTAWHLQLRRCQKFEKLVLHGYAAAFYLCAAISMLVALLFYVWYRRPVPDDPLSAECSTECSAES
jgi:hypothetical protein